MAIGDFTAYLIEKEGDAVGGRLTTMSPAQLDEGELTIRVHFSSINYKDALAATGAGKIVRRFPCVGGIDLAGEVVESADARFQPGDPVVATSFDLGVSHHGGYAQYARVPSKWALPLPSGLTPFESMALGTAGFTAALAIVRMEGNGLASSNGPVVVTGATGGVGGLAIDMLSQLGYEVVALTRKSSEEQYLLALGASSVELVSRIDLANVRPLERARWAGAVDNVGGAILPWVLASMKQAGTVASIGNAAGIELNTTVFPFILRGVSLLGVDSAYTAFPARQRVWDRLATDLKPKRLRDVVRIIDLDQLPGAFADYLAGRIKGRTVVRILPDARA